MLGPGYVAGSVDSWTVAGAFGQRRFVCITVILVIGIKESAGFNAGMVMVKLAVVLFVIAVGSFYVDPKNWQPFMPYGFPRSGPGGPRGYGELRTRVFPQRGLQSQAPRTDAATAERLSCAPGDFTHAFE